MTLRTSCFALFVALALSAPAAWAGNQKVQVCHIPPGNPSNFHTITISQSALQAHLGHGDFAGPCFAHCDQLCSDGNACTIDACDASENCLATHPSVNCDDGNKCTLDTCSPATGCSSAPRVCSDGNLCTVDSCDPLTGACVFPPAVCPQGQTCNLGNGNCEVTNVDECLSDPCLNGACIDGQNSFSCACQPGWTGRLCDVDIDECESNPCLNGDCTDQVNAFTCSCLPGFSGTFCETQDGGCIVDNILCFGNGEKKK